MQISAGEPQQTENEPQTIHFKVRFHNVCYLNATYKKVNLFRSARFNPKCLNLFVFVKLK